MTPGSIKSGITDATAGYQPPDTDWSLLAKLSPILLVSDDGAFIIGTEIRIDGGAHA